MASWATTFLVGNHSGLVDMHRGFRATPGFCGQHMAFWATKGLVSNPSSLAGNHMGLIGKQSVHVQSCTCLFHKIFESIHVSAMIVFFNSQQIRTLPFSETSFLNWGYCLKTFEDDWHFRYSPKLASYKIRKLTPEAWLYPKPLVLTVNMGHRTNTTVFITDWCIISTH